MACFGTAVLCDEGKDRIGLLFELHVGVTQQSLLIKIELFLAESMMEEMKGRTHGSVATVEHQGTFYW